MKKNFNLTFKTLLLGAALLVAFTATGQVAYDIDDNERLGKVDAANKEAVMMENADHSYFPASEVDQLPSIGKTCEYVQSPNTCTAQLLNAYITENLNFPSETKKAGTLVKEVEFVVTEHGTMEDIAIISGRKEDACQACNEAIIAVVSSMDNWIPGIKDGEIVSVKMTFPITFKIK